MKRGDDVMAVEISLFMYQSSNLHGKGERKMEEIGNRLMNENVASFHVQSVGQGAELLLLFSSLFCYNFFHSAISSMDCVNHM